MVLQGPRGDLASVFVKVELATNNDVNNDGHLEAVLDYGISSHQLRSLESGGFTCSGQPTTGGSRGSLAGGIIVPESGIYMVTTTYILQCTLLSLQRGSIGVRHYIYNQ